MKGMRFPIICLVALCLSVCFFMASALQHNCIHEEIAKSFPLFQEGFLNHSHSQADSNGEKKNMRLFSASQPFEPIRVKADLTGLNNLTNETLKTMIVDAIDIAISTLQKLLKVRRMTKPLNIS